MARKTDPRLDAILLASLLAAAGSAAPGAADASPRSDPAATPVLVELFTSEGCSSCPPADALLADLAALPAVEGARVVPVGYHVTYWDRLGWRDRFSDPAWSTRQEDYARALGETTVYTPQAIVDGRVAVVGSRGRDLRRALRSAAEVARIPLELRATRSGRRLEVAVSLPEGLVADDAEAWVALTENGLATDVERGENASRRLHHVAVLRWRESLGAIRPARAPIELAKADLELRDEWIAAHLDLLAVVQLRGPGAVLAVATLPLREIVAGPRP